MGSKQGDGEGICKQVADLYVFLLHHLLAAEQGINIALIEEIRAVPRVEAETWRLACANDVSPAPGHFGTGSGAGGLNLEA